MVGVPRQNPNLSDLSFLSVPFQMSLSKNTMNTTFQTTTISDFLDLFAGRRSMEGYDDTKPTKIAECNRDFVWSLQMQKEFIRSILQGFPIPAMCICNSQIVDGGNRSTTLWLYRNNVFAVRVDSSGSELNYDAMCTDRVLTRRWDSAVIPQQIITNATPDQFAQIYENLNKGVRLTFGQLLENRKYCSWVALAEAMIGRGEAIYTDRELLHRVWTPRFIRTKQRTELGFAFQVLAGSELGPEHFHLSFAEHLPLIMGDTVPTTDKLRTILEMISVCDPEHIISDKKKKEIFKKFIGPIIHDLHTMDGTDWSEKWTSFLQEAYNRLGKRDMKTIMDVGVLRAVSATKIAGVAENVRKYLAGELEADYDSDMSSDDSDV